MGCHPHAPKIGSALQKLRFGGNIVEFFDNINPVLQGLLATLFTWAITALGAAVVFFFRDVNKKLLNIMLGFGAGVMIAASFWSLLAPAIELCGELGKSQWILPSLGFVTGGLFMIVADKLLDKSSFVASAAGKSASLKRSILLVSAVTLHNIPEGMAVGVAFGGAAMGVPGSTLMGAGILAVGIGLQNFPEGASVALPLRREGYSRLKSFLYGQASGLVEPIAAVIGVVAAMAMREILPFLLSFSAGAMISVVSAELIPESINSNKNLSVLGIVMGFLVMMILDVALG